MQTAACFNLEAVKAQIHEGHQGEAGLTSGRGDAGEGQIHVGKFLPTPRHSPARRRWLLWVVLAVAAVAALLAANTYLMDSRTRAAAPRDGGNIVDTKVRAGERQDRGECPPIVMIHGFSEAIDWWDEIAPTLAKDHRVIRIDLTGHGGTEAPASGYSMEQQAAMVAAVLDKLGVDRFTLIAHSMGGIVSTAFIEARPDKVERLVLIATPPKAETTFNLGTRLALTRHRRAPHAACNTNSSIRKQMEEVFTPGFQCLINSSPISGR